jgi:lipopolysaccharide assembly outer membrane protein LptD (OstA)
MIRAMKASLRIALARIHRALRGGTALTAPVLAVIAAVALSGAARAQSLPVPGGSAPAGAQQQTSLPAVFSADEVIYDRDRDIVTATGNVEIVQGNRVIRADSVSFDRRQNVVSASGNVSLLEPTGDVIFADHAQLTEDLREGAIQNFRALLADWSRLAAVSGRRSNGNVTALRKVVYSPCELCKDDPSRPPVWQIKAARATHDQEAATVSYRDAWIEIGGVPVLYTPYLEHPDGTVRRKSGLLTPSFGSSSVLGQFYAQPYFQTLGDSADITLEPIVYSKENPVLAAEYRRRFRAGAMALNGSLTYAHVYDDRNRRTGEDTMRGHIAGTGRFDIDDDWRWGFDIARASHDNYLLRYKLFDRFRFIDRNTLTSRGYVEGFRGRSYASATTYAFQGLREFDDPGLAPLVLPLLDYQWIGEPDRRGGYLHFQSYSYGIYRTEGTASQRTAGVWGYTLPFTASTGEVWSLTGTLQGDLFHADRGRIVDSFAPTARASPRAPSRRSRWAGAGRSCATTRPSVPSSSRSSRSSRRRGSATSRNSPTRIRAPSISTRRTCSGAIASAASIASKAASGSTMASTSICGASRPARGSPLSLARAIASSATATSPPSRASTTTPPTSSGACWSRRIPGCRAAGASRRTRAISAPPATPPRCASVPTRSISSSPTTSSIAVRSPACSRISSR